MQSEELYNEQRSASALLRLGVQPSAQRDVLPSRVSMHVMQQMKSTSPRQGCRRCNEDVQRADAWLVKPNSIMPQCDCRRCIVVSRRGSVCFRRSGRLQGFNQDSVVVKGAVHLHAGLRCC